MALHFPDSLVEAVVTEIVRIDRLALPVASVVRARLIVRDGEVAASLADIEVLITTYEHVVTTLAAYLPVVRRDTR